jgi:hypothetical protein
MRRMGGMIVLVLVAAGCASHSTAPGERGVQETVPPPQFGSLYIDKLSGSYRIRAAGLEEYVGRYGTRGWLKGLFDERPASAAVAAPTDAYPSALRVNDVFAYYYWQTHGRRKEYEWPRNATPQQRDVVIAQMRAELAPR